MDWQSPIPQSHLHESAQLLCTVNPSKKNKQISRDRCTFLKQNPNPLKIHHFSWNRGGKSVPNFKAMKQSTTPCDASYRELKANQNRSIQTCPCLQKDTDKSPQSKPINKKDNVFLSLFLFVLNSGLWTPFPRGGRQVLGKQSLWTAKSTVLTKLNNFASSSFKNKIKYWDERNPWAPRNFKIRHCSSKPVWKLLHLKYPAQDSNNLPV